MKFIKVKVDPRFDVNEQTVFVGGSQMIEIGSVHCAWFRSGGDSWTHSRVGACGFKTRKEAAKDLFRIWREINA